MYFDKNDLCDSCCVLLSMRMFRRSPYFSTSTTLFPLSLLMALSDCWFWITSMLAGSFMKFVSSSDVIVLVLLICSNRRAVSSLVEESFDDEINFFGGLALTLSEDNFIDKQGLLEPEENVFSIASIEGLEYKICSYYGYKIWRQIFFKLLN